jgi:hypothetical protein
MAQLKYANCFITADNPNAKLPTYRVPIDPRFVKRVTQVDQATYPGAQFYCETMWILPGFDKQAVSAGKNGNFWEEHTHEFGELIGFYGFNYDDIMDLGAEIEFWIDGKKYDINESFTSFIPAGIKHGPLTIKNVKRPLVHYIACDTPTYK